MWHPSLHILVIILLITPVIAELTVSPPSCTLLSQMPSGNQNNLSPVTMGSHSGVITKSLNPIPTYSSVFVNEPNSNPVQAVQPWEDHEDSSLPASTSPSIDGVAIFPSDHIWNVPVTSLPVHSRSSDYIDKIGRNSHAHPDFGSGLWEGHKIGIPYVVVPGTQPKKPVVFYYAGESDSGPYPIPDNPPIEGGSDHHMLIIDKDAKKLYELYAAELQSDGSWHAGSGAIFDLTGYGLRTDGWTSADAAGLPILPGLVRYEEVAAGEITHAIRFTAPSTQRAYVWPARHYASSITAITYPPMGQRFRLKSTFDVSGYPPQAKIVLNALKKYGMILADNGAAWYLSGVPNEGWDNTDLHTLQNVYGSDFEAVDSSSLMIHPDSGRARVNSASNPQIGIFRSGMFLLDYDGSYGWSGSGSTSTTDRIGMLGQSGDTPLVGDWNGDGITEFGIFRSGMFLLDYDGSYGWSGSGSTSTTDRIGMLGQAGDTPLVGDWNGDGKTEFGIFRSGMFLLDYDGSYGWSGSGSTPTTDRIGMLGQSGDTPLVGDWNDDNKSEFGIFRNGMFLLDYDGNYGWSGSGSTLTTDRIGMLGQSGDTPLVGDWNCNGKDTFGIFRGGMFLLDYDGNYGWSGSGSTSTSDRIGWLGQSGDTPLVGAWADLNAASALGCENTGGTPMPVQSPPVTQPVDTIPKVEIPVKGSQSLSPVVKPSSQNPLAGGGIHQVDSLV